LDAIRTSFAKKKKIRFTSAGQNIRGAVYYPEGGLRAPGVLLLHTASGLTSHEHAIASRLAREGFTSMVVAYSKRTSGIVIRDDYRRLQMEQIALDSFHMLQADPRVDAGRTAVIGLSMGGYFAIHIAGFAEEPAPKAVIVYYGMYAAAETKLARVRAPLLILQGEEDSKEFVQNAKRAREISDLNQQRCELVLYHDAGHQFDFFAPNSDATRDARARTIEFLRQNLTP
jgi:dienelactone hydrolase